ncbi:hypothetical protein N7488_008677 [Penicillium malachiteum]|nr:hypothetical protein N7488_008677 [Penicillium malachiteum]
MADCVGNVAFIGNFRPDEIRRGEEHLSKNGPTGTLFVFDIFRRACERFRDEFKDFGLIVIVESSKEAATMSQTIISIVPGASKVKDVYLNEITGVIAVPNNMDRLIMECSTIDSQSRRGVGEALRNAGVGTYIDTPVSGGVPGADSGTLFFLIGHTEPSDTDPISHRLETVAAMMGDPKKFFYCGKPGAGLAAKISNNYLSCSILLAVAEAMAIGIISGTDEKLLHEVIQNSTGQCFMADKVGLSLMLRVAITTD